MVWEYDDPDTLFYVFADKGSSIGIMYFIITYFLSDFIAQVVSLRPYFEPFESWSQNNNWNSFSKNKGTPD